MFAYIPARGGSKRIPKKNMSLVDGIPLIGHVITNLLSVPSLTGISVSTDDPSTLSYVQSLDQSITTLSPRASYLSSDTSTFVDLVRHDLPRFVEHFSDENVLFVLPTAILINSNHFIQAVSLHNNHPTSLVMCVSQPDTSALLTFRESDEAIVPLSPDSFLLPTADLPKTYFDCGCFYIFNVPRMSSYSKFIDMQPILPYEVDRAIGIDVDTPRDLELLLNSFNHS